MLSCKPYRDQVFPARAGMNRCTGFRSLPAGCVPRASGDEPLPEGGEYEGELCSPRERG